MIQNFSKILDAFFRHIQDALRIEIALFHHRQPLIELTVKGRISEIGEIVLHLQRNNRSSGIQTVLQISQLILK